MITLQPQATPHALNLPPNLSTKEWANYGQFLKDAGKSLVTWRADWLRYGQSYFTPAVVAEAVDQLHLDFGDETKMIAVANVNPRLRRDSLTDAHYVAVGKRCENDLEREEWLNIAEREGLSARELQASIRAGKITRVDEDGRRVSMPSPYAVRAEFNAWKKEVGDSWQDWSDQDKAEVAGVLYEIADFWRVLK